MTKAIKEMLHQFERVVNSFITVISQISIENGLDSKSFRRMVRTALQVKTASECTHDTDFDDPDTMQKMLHNMLSMFKIEGIVHKYYTDAITESEAVDELEELFFT